MMDTIRIIIWGCGFDYNKYINLIKYQELLGNVKIVGITDQREIYESLDGYRFIPIGKIRKYNINYVVVTSRKYYEDICKEAYKIGFEKENIILASVFQIPGFDLGKYVNLLKSNISIISRNCWGGMTYHALGMRFLSPFINMYLRDEDYIRLLQNLQHYMSERLTFKEWGYTPVLQRNYPICRLGDVELQFNHDISVEEVESKWYTRLERINWDNLFFMTFTGDKKALQKFHELPYKKKICFVPFESELDSAYVMSFLRKGEMQDVPFYTVVNGVPQGLYSDYNLIDLLMTGTAKHDRCYIKKENA